MTNVKAMDKREIAVIILILLTSFALIGVGIYYGQFNLAYRETIGNNLTDYKNGLYVSNIITLNYTDQFSITANETPTLVLVNSTVNISQSYPNDYVINYTEVLGNIYTYPSLQGRYVVIFHSNYRPEFSYSIVSPTIYYSISLILLGSGLVLLISDAVLIYILIAKGYLGD